MGSWVKAFDASTMEDGSVRAVKIGSKTIAVARVGDEFFAVDNVCLHRGGPLGEGGLDGYDVICPWHGWTYDVRDGSFKVIPALRVKTYPVKLEGDSVMVDIGAVERR